MSPWKTSLLFLCLSAGTFAQMAQQQSDAGRQVGLRIACQCGSCQDTVSGCKMAVCGFSSPAKAKIAAMLAAGETQESIRAAFYKEYGQGVSRELPSGFSWLVPYAVLVLGALLVMFIVKRSRKPKPVLAVDPQLARYNEQIEKELANLD